MRVLPGWLWSVVLVDFALGAEFVVLTNVGQPLRAITVFCFLLICPGTAVIRLLRIKDPLATLVLGVALSIAIDMVVAEVMVYGRIWSMPHGVLSLVVVTIAAAGLNPLLDLWLAHSPPTLQTVQSKETGD